MREQLREQERREQQRTSRYLQRQSRGIPSAQTPAIDVSAAPGLPAGAQVPMEVLKVSPAPRRQLRPALSLRSPSLSGSHLLIFLLSSRLSRGSCRAPCRPKGKLSALPSIRGIFILGEFLSNAL